MQKQIYLHFIIEAKNLKNIIYFRNNIVKSFFIHIFILKLFFNQKNAL